MKVTSSSLFTLFSVLMLLTYASGCDSVAATALQTGEAGLRTIVDLLLTDFTNQVADALQMTVTT